jgi:hypothetical protein
MHDYACAVAHVLTITKCIEFKFFNLRFLTFYLTRQVSSEQILIYNDGLPRPNPDDAGPIVRRPMVLPVMARCFTAWIRTRDSRDTCCNEMQCLSSDAAPLGSPEGRRIRSAVRELQSMQNTMTQTSSLVCQIILLAFL